MHELRNSKPMMTRCWNCGTEHDRVASADHNEIPTPNNGDITFCFMCGSFAIFDDAFPDAIRKPNPDENFEIRHNKTLQRVLVLWLAHRNKD
jgi:hypothetical protein